MGRPSRMPSHDLSNPQNRERRDVLGSENGLRCRDVFHPVLGNPVRAADGPKPLFASDDVLSLTLTGPLDTISRDIAAKPVPGVLKVGGAAPETMPVTCRCAASRGARKRYVPFRPCVWSSRKNPDRLPSSRDRSGSSW